MNTVEAIKDKLSIEDVVSSYIKLEPAGKNLKAQCPFHNEKTPSFMVSPDRGTYHCFGCGRGGDIFSFVEEFEGTDFKGALKVLADRAGVQIKRINPKEKDARDRLYAALDEAALFFEHGLRKSERACAYLKERGLTEKTIQTWRLGYVPLEWRALKVHMEKRGYTEDELLKTGLIKKSDKGGEPYDTFRGRIIFPISDTTGRVVGFSGRVFENDSEAKYLNTPETALFDKSKILYGLHIAKTEIRRYSFCILVEGQMDVLAAHQAGFTNTIAIQGTALTPKHAEVLKRLTGNIVIALDADEAGVRSAGKSALQGLALGMDTKVAHLPKGSDPADLIQEDLERWKTCIRKASHIVEFLAEHILEEEGDLRTQKLRMRKEVLPFIAHMDNKVDQAHFLSYLARVSDVPEAALREEMHKVADTLRMPSTKEEPAQTAAHHTPNSDGTYRIARLYIGLIHSEKTKKKPAFDLSEAEKKLREFVGEELYTTLTSEGDAHTFEAEQLYAEDPKKGYEELFHLLKAQMLREEFAKRMQELKQAEMKNDSSRALELLRMCKTLSEELEQIRSISSTH